MTLFCDLQIDYFVASNFLDLRCWLSGDWYMYIRYRLVRGEKYLQPRDSRKPHTKISRMRIKVGLQ